MTLSIIIPVFNGSKYIRECLESINNLDYPRERYEIIVIDGGSTDNTPEIVKEFTNVNIFYSKKGTSHQRNVGIEKARGE